MSIVVAAQHYGTSRVRLVKVSRFPDRHEVRELCVDVVLGGDFIPAYTEGDNRNILPPDTIKNTVYVMARNHPLDQVEDFGQVLAARFFRFQPQVSRVRVAIAERPWTRLVVGARAQRSTFLRTGAEERLAVVAATRDSTKVQAGVQNLIALKTSGAAFEGFRKDPYTTLEESRDRLLGASIRATWTYCGGEIPFALNWHGVRQTVLETYAEHESRSPQETAYIIGEAVLETHTDVSDIQLEMRITDYLLPDLSRFGVENENDIFQPLEEPWASVEAHLSRQS